ncbi:TolC family protein [bacterium]|nr:TolC family protein [bacterium]
MRTVLGRCLLGAFALLLFIASGAGVPARQPSAYATDVVEVMNADSREEPLGPRLDETDAVIEEASESAPARSGAFEPLTINASWEPTRLHVSEYGVPTDREGMLEYLAEAYAQPDAQLTLAEAIDMALANNHDLNRKRFAAAAAFQEVKVNWAALRPQLDLQARMFYQQTNQPPVTLGPSDGEEEPLELSFTTEGELISFLALSLTQRIYDFGLTSSEVDLASARHAIQAYTVDMAEQQLVYDVIVAYYNFNLALGQAKIRSDELALAQEFLRQTQIQYEVGTVPRLDVIRAEARVEQARSGFISAQGMLGDAVAAFFSLLGAGDQRYVPAVLTSHLLEMGDPPPPADSVVENALNCRPEIELQYAALFAGKAEKSLANNRPILEAYVNARYQEPVSSFQGTDSYEYGLQVNWPLYTGGKDVRERKQRELELLALSEGVLDLEAKVELDATMAWNRAVAGRSAVGAALKNLELSAEALHAAAVGYGAGVTPYLDFEDALDQNVAAALQYLFALAEVKMGQANLVRAQGFPDGYPGDARPGAPKTPSVYGILGLDEEP